MMHINHLTNQLNTRARNIVRVVIADVHHYSLGATTITTVEDFANNVTAFMLSRTSNCGKKSMTEIVRACRDLGFPIRDAVSRVEREWNMWCSVNDRAGLKANESYAEVWNAAWRAAMKARIDTESSKEEHVLKESYREPR